MWLLVAAGLLCAWASGLCFGIIAGRHLFPILRNPQVNKGPGTEGQRKPEGTP